MHRLSRPPSSARCAHGLLLLLLAGCEGPAGAQPLASTGQVISTSTSISTAAAPTDASERDAGRPDAPCRDSGQSFSFDDLYTAIAVDLGAAEADAAPFYRYLALTNRFNAGVCSDTALDQDRHALAKAVNMLSTDARVTAPHAIDAARMIYRVDLRDYAFDRPIEHRGNRFDDVWEAVSAANPYAVPFVGEQASEARRAAATTVPVMFSDSFIDVALVGNLYYAIIGLDVNDTVDDFIANRLEVDVEQNLATGAAARAGTTRSRISHQDRVVERHDLGVRSGALWQSFDFELSSRDEGGIFADPFGLDEGNREAIFTLPNGLMAFLVADEDGFLVSVSDIIIDPERRSLDALVTVSCAGCHAGGFQPVVDEVGPAYLANATELALTDEEIEQIESLYPAPAEFQELVTRDSENFYLAALSRLGVPAGETDPVSRIYLQFDRDLSIFDAAGDLGTSASELRQKLGVLHPAMQILADGTQDRDDFSQLYVDSLCRVSGDRSNRPDPDLCGAAAADLPSLP